MLYRERKSRGKNNKGIDVVSMATESGYHPSMTIYAMNKGKHVIVEKPMALSIEDDDKMITVTKENNLKLCVSHQNRFNKSIQMLRHGNLIEVLLYESVYS